jgi:type IV secretion system protein VirB2
MNRIYQIKRVIHTFAPLIVFAAHHAAMADGFDKINTTTNNVVAILVTIAIAVVTAAIMWAGFKMIFQAARLSDVANILFGGTLIGGASAMAAFIVS